MARTKKQEPKQEKQDKQEAVVVTRAEKKDATKNLIKEVLSLQPLKHNDLLDEVAKLYSKRFGADTDNPNDVKGRVGSVLDIMKKEGEVANDGGMYALKARLPLPTPVEAAEETPVKKATKKSAVKEEKTGEPQTEKPIKKTAKKSAKTKKEEAVPPASVEEKPAVDTALDAVPAQTEKAEKPKRATKKKAEANTDEKPVKKTRKTAKKATVETEQPTEATEEKAEIKEEVKAEPISVPEEKIEKKEEAQTEVKNLPVIKEKAELAPKAEVMDMSFLFGAVKPVKTETKPQEKPVEKPVEKTEEKPTPKTETQAEQKEEKKPEIKAEQKPLQKAQKPEQPQSQRPVQEQAKSRVLKAVKKADHKPMSAEEKLCDNFLKKLRSLGGDYFEYYSIYLLERYSRKNGRRLESLKISGGDRDGGIDGEIELTDRLGFRETIYIQSKNWDPDRGNERLWVVGETLLQQFIGACLCKQAKDGKQHTRGIFITTSNFTPDAKRILEDMSDKIVGYDGNDLFEAAKECQFGLLYENGNWKLDEKLLSGTKAFFNM